MNISFYLLANVHKHFRNKTKQQLIIDKSLHNFDILILRIYLTKVCITKALLKIIIAMYLFCIIIFDISCYYLKKCFISRDYFNILCGYHKVKWFILTTFFFLNVFLVKNKNIEVNYIFI